MKKIISTIKLENGKSINLIVDTKQVANIILGKLHQ
jgi:hypothetical protein